MNCRSCGAYAPDNGIFCPRCGKRLEKPAEAEPEVAATAAVGEEQGAAVTEEPAEVVSPAGGQPAEAPVAEDSEGNQPAEAPEPDQPAASSVSGQPVESGDASERFVPEPPAGWVCGTPALMEEEARKRAQEQRAGAAQPQQPGVGECPQPQQPGAGQPQPVYEVPVDQVQGTWQAGGATDFGAAGSPAGAAGAAAGAGSSYGAPGASQQAASGWQSAQGGASWPPVYQQGCVAAAVEDIKGQPGLAKKVALLGLIECVPILNFVVAGYALNWAREVPFGAKTSLPQKIVNGQNFEIGFYAFLVALVVGLVGGLASSLLGLIPILGWVAAVAISLGASLFQYLMEMRLGIMQQLAEGFKITMMWNVMKRNWTGLLCAALVPGLVAAGVICAVSLVFSLLVAAVSVPLGLAESAAGIGLFGGLLAIVIVLLCLVLIVACGVCIAAAEVVTVRAVAHWVARYAPEWATDAYNAANQYQGYQTY